MKTIQILFYCTLMSLMMTTYASENKDSEKKKKSEPAKAVSTGDKIYTWIDSSGNRIYSDVPREGAKVMKIEKGTDYTPPQSTTDYSTMRPKVVLPDAAGYSNFTIASPANDATVRNNNGNFQVALDIRPALHKGHSIKLEIDGKEIEGSGSSIISLSNIDRGSHNLTAYILSARGELVATTPSITIHMHRATKRN